MSLCLACESLVDSYHGASDAQYFFAALRAFNEVEVGDC